MNIFHAKFSTGQIIKATGITNDTLQNWLKRKLIIGQKDIEGGGSQGRHRQFSFRNAMEIAVAKALVDLGVDLKVAFHAAGGFAHTGEYMPGSPERAPGCPFNKHPGITLIAANKDWSDEVFLSPNDSALELYNSLLSRGGIGAVILDAGAIFDIVTVRLGYHPEKVLEVAYPKAKDLSAQ